MNIRKLRETCLIDTQKALWVSNTYWRGSDTQLLLQKVCLSFCSRFSELAYDIKPSVSGGYMFGTCRPVWAASVYQIQGKLVKKHFKGTSVNEINCTPLLKSVTPMQPKLFYMYILVSEYTKEIMILSLWKSHQLSIACHTQKLASSGLEPWTCPLYVLDIPIWASLKVFCLPFFDLNFVLSM